MTEDEIVEWHHRLDGQAPLLDNLFCALDSMTSQVT